MESCRTRSGIAAFVFAILLLAFNWPLLSIQPRGMLLLWLFCAWGLGIGLLALAARCADPAGRQGGEACGPEAGDQARPDRESREGGGRGHDGRKGDGPQGGGDV